jgi:3-oxoacyl-[acyl-carrier protein] reductase
MLGRVAFVTGGASGIGRALCAALVARGARVTVADINASRARAVAEELDGRGPGSATAVSLDVADAIGFERAVSELQGREGRLDLLFNNAGTPGTRRRITPPELDLITEDLWSQLLQTNLLGVFRGSKTAAPALKAAHGAIVSTASIAGLGRAGSSLAYSATKAGVVSLTQNLARALAPEVRVNAIAPGAVDSSWMVEWTNEERQQSIERALLKRRCQPEDLAEVVVFLGFGAAMVTGQTITVDGGLTL